MNKLNEVESILNACWDVQEVLPSTTADLLVACTLTNSLTVTELNDALVVLCAMYGGSSVKALSTDISKDDYGTLGEFTEQVLYFFNHLYPAPIPPLKIVK